MTEVAAVAVLGAGAWGTALSNLLARAGHVVRLWTFDAEHAQRLERERENRQFFPGVPLADGVRVTSEIERAVKAADFILIAVPSHAVRKTLTLAKPEVAPSTALVSCSKGIEEGSLMLMSEVTRDVLAPSSPARIAALSGPSFALEVARGLPTNVVVASDDAKLCQRVQMLMATERFRVYASDDTTGVEVGGALKNVIAIAAGASDGLGFGLNTRAALITRGLAEIGRLAMAKGGQLITLSGLAGLGDLILTCTGELSRNRTLGFELARGKRLTDVLRGLGAVAEGVRTAKSGFELAQALNVDLPILTEVYRVLYEDKPPAEAVRDLLSRPLRKEFG